MIDLCKLEQLGSSLDSDKIDDHSSVTEPSLNQ